MSLPLTDYFNIFTPDNAVRSIEQFAGRQQEIDHLADALQSNGTNIVIFGNRGVGKSSLARQLEALSTNSAPIIERLSNRPFRDFDFLCLFLAVDDSITTIESLIIRLLRSNEALSPWIPLEIKESVGKLGAALTVGAPGIKLKASAKDEYTAASPQLPNDVVSVFKNACYEVSSAAKDGVLFIIDEFDRIQDKAGFASLVKSFEGQPVRFAVVGVARDIENLVVDHASISRQISGGAIKVNPMTEVEITQLFKQVHHKLEESIIFSDEAIRYISNCAKGHPYIVHLLGRQCLVSAAREKRNVITEDEARRGLSEISSSGSNIPLELEYRNAVKNSPTREYILKRFAREDKEPMRTTDIYSDISEALKIEKEAISVYMGHLSSPDYGPILEKAGERYYRFVNSVFKAYAAARQYEVYKATG